MPQCNIAAFYTAVALLRLGWIINYLSQPVISGFMTGAASIIVATQVKYLTGQYDLPRSDTVYHALYYMFNNMNLFRTPEFGMGFSLVLILLFCLILGSRYQCVFFSEVSDINFLILYICVLFHFPSTLTHSAFSLETLHHNSYFFSAGD